MTHTALASPPPGDPSWLEGRPWTETGPSMLDDRHASHRAPDTGWLRDDGWNADNHAENGMHWQPAWRAGVGHPHGVADLPPLPQQAAGHYGTGYGDEQRHFGGTNPAATPAWHDEHAHYRQLRDEHARQLDSDYEAWRRHRFATEFERWRGLETQRAAPEHEGALQGFGRAIAETVSGSGTRAPDMDELDREGGGH
jgi:hypothetical protein